MTIFSMLALVIRTVGADSTDGAFASDRSASVAENVYVFVYEFVTPETVLFELR